MTTRRRSPGFTGQAKEETASVEESLDSHTQEMFETISREEKEDEAEVEVKEKVEAPLPVVLPEIIPTEDVGPRFVGESTPPHRQEVTPSTTPQIQPSPKRHPRNIPKFSRTKG